MGKITQTAGRNALGEFAPEIVHYNRCCPYGIGNNRLIFENSFTECQKSRRYKERNSGSHYPCGSLRRLA